MNSKFRIGLSQVTAVFVKNILLMSYGMTLGFPTILIGGLISEETEEFSKITQNQISWIGSITFISTLVGSLLSGVATQPLGRKGSMQITSIPFILCWIGFYFSTKFWHIYLTLIIMGLFGGLVIASFMSYASEICEPHLRGVLATSGSAFTMLGSFLQFLLGTFFPWKTCALISCFPPLASLILFFFVPESPYWLLLNKKIDKAEKSLAWLRGWTKVNNIKIEIEEMIKNITATNESIGEQIFNKSFIVPFGIITCLFFLLYFTGVATLQAYAINTFTTLKVPINSYDATMFFGLTQVLGTTLGGGLISRLGRRKLIFTSLTGVCVCNILIGIYVYLKDIKYIIIAKVESPNDLDLTYLPLMILLVLSFTYYFGLNILPWAIMGEVFSHQSRTAGCGLSISVGCLLQFVSLKIYLDVTSSITLFYTYLLQAIIAFVGIIIMYFVLPETEGKTLNEIENHFKGDIPLDRNLNIDIRD